MEARLTRLEQAFEKLDGKLDQLLNQNHALEVRLAEIKGKVDASPTTIQLFGFIIATFVAAGVLKYFGH